MSHHSRMFANALPVGTLTIEGGNATIALGAASGASPSRSRPVAVILASLLVALLLAGDR